VYNIKNVTQSEGRSTTLICLSWGDPPPEMTYRKEGHSEDYVLGSNVIFLSLKCNISSSPLTCVFTMCVLQVLSSVIYKPVKIM